jgi:ABC-type oligopeptide transport system ATPase subunit
MQEPILSLENVAKTFRSSGGRAVHALRGVSLSVARGETVALVGESGSGKSTLGRIALGLLAPDSGRVVLEGKVLGELSPEELRKARVAMQPIFQDASSSLNPRRSARELMAQALRHGAGPLDERSAELLDRVGLSPGRDYLPRFPHEISGGQRQRLAIARALAMNPRLIIADEPLSGADVSIRGQILNLLLDIREERNVAYLMITHDISIARHFADRVAVMQHGVIVETGPAAQVLTAPSHPYTQQLLAAVPVLETADGAAA